MKARSFLAASLFLSACTLPVLAKPSQTPQKSSPLSPKGIRQPKLVVAIVVDQLRYDYLERFHDLFGKRGFRTLMDEGAFLTFAHYNYAPTVTGPGHASFLSGAPPAVHGIINNDWFDKRTLKSINCVGDAEVESVGTPSSAGKRSPRNFNGSNVADEMRLRFQSKVVGVSLKDRGAILPAGKKPAGAYWFDSAGGNFITSTYYTNELPAWVRTFNERKLPASFIGRTWKRLLEPSKYQWPDDAPGEGRLATERASTFDHVVNPSPSEGFETIVPTPFGSELLVEMAIAAVEGEQLGSRTDPDLLCISFSSPDAAGHLFGPYSQEVQDILLRLDLQLGELLSRLDQKLGLENVAVVLSADHGVAPTPEFASQQGLEAGRDDSSGLTGELLQRLEERFGSGKFLLSPRVHEGQVYLDHAALRERQLSTEEVSLFARDWALNSGRFQAAYTRNQLLDGRAPGPLGQRILNGFHAERSGDLVLVPKPFHIAGSGKSGVGTTHGSVYSYDTHVPVLLYGQLFKPGRYADDFAITDLAPTLCAALHLNEPSGSIGKPFVKALAEQPVPQSR